MDNNPRARFQKVANALTAVTAVREEGQTRGQERKHKGNLPPPVSRPDHMPSEYHGSSYGGASGSHGVQNQGPSWYNQNNTSYPPHASTPSQPQPYQQYSSHGQYTSSPLQESSLQQPSGYYPPQNPVNSLHSAGPWSAQDPNAPNGSQSQVGYQHPSDPNHYQQTSQQIPPPPQAYSPPFSGPSHPQRPQLQTSYGSQPYNLPVQDLSPARPQAYFPPFGGPGHSAPPQGHPQPDHRSFSDAPSAPERCIHGEILGSW